jgi:putative membrane protein (TIGR04086 family)
MKKLGAVCKGILGAYLLTGIILSLLALWMYRLNPSGDYLRVGIVFAYLFSSFVGGFLTGRRIEKKRFLWGLVAGLFYFGILFVVSIALGRDVFGRPATALTVFFMCTLGGMLGGMIGG